MWSGDDVCWLLDNLGATDYIQAAIIHLQIANKCGYTMNLSSSGS